MNSFKLFCIVVLLIFGYIIEAECKLNILRAKRQWGWGQQGQVNTETEVINGPGFQETIVDTQRRGWNGREVDTETEVIRGPGFTEVISETQNGWGR
uniref:Uncharacterized protein n=1 Tax=Acrobeloides nanus TaxID=290746 RepID=A0A914CVM5_9BILA